MERLAKTILLAAKLREESFDPEMAEKNQFGDCYKLSLRAAADMAAEQTGYDERGTDPVYLLLKHSWNDILAWAKVYDTPMSIPEYEELLEPINPEEQP
jgi:hypothetical protein